MPTSATLETPTTEQTARPIHCVECGEPISYNYGFDVPERLATFGLCYHCDYWVEVLSSKHLGVVFEKLGGRRCHCQPILTTRGQESIFDKFYRLTDGTILRCSKVWHQDEIPMNFFDRFPVSGIEISKADFDKELEV